MLTDQVPFPWPCTPPCDPQTTFHPDIASVREVLSANDIALPEQVVPPLAHAVVNALDLLVMTVSFRPSRQQTYQLFETLVVFCAALCGKRE